MRLAAILTLLVTATLLAASAADIEAAWNTGDRDRVRAALGAPVQPDEEPCRLYYGALLNPDQTTVEADLTELVKRYPGSAYAARANLTLAQMLLLRRDAAGAIERLNTLGDDMNAQYWLSLAWLAKDEYARCIRAAENCGVLTSDTNVAEICRFTVAEAYARKGDYTRALTTLNSLKNSATLCNRTLLLYQLGYCYEMLGDYDNAKGYYRRLMTDFAYTQYAYRAEDRMLAMRDAAHLDVTDFSICDQDRESAQHESTPPEDGEPVLRFYLQVGAFSTEDRARDLVRDMQRKGYPAVCFTKTVSGTVWQVAAVGPFADRPAALDAKDRLATDGVSSMLLQRY